MGLLSFCIFKTALSLGAVGFICSRCLYWFLSFVMLHLWIISWICFENNLWDLYLKLLFGFLVKMYCFSALVHLYILWPWFYLYLLLLLLGYFVPVEAVFVLDYIHVFCVECYVYWFTVICLIFLDARYLKVFCIFTSGYLMVFSVSTISALMKCFGFFLWWCQILSSTYLFLTEFHLYHIYKSCTEAMFHYFFVMENERFVSL